MASSSYYNPGPFGWVRAPADRISRFADPKLCYLAISGVEAATNEAELLCHNITHVVTLMNRLDPDLERLLARIGIRQHFVSIDDAPDVDLLAVARRLYPLLDRWRRDIQDDDGCILVHCRMGISRSATLVLYHLMRSWAHAAPRSDACT